MTTWISDDNGNRCSVEYWGSKDNARKALASNKDCKNCSDCSRCSDCSDCSGCSRCSRCSRCSDCSGCSRCSRCSRCSGCSDCCQNIAWLIGKHDLQAEPPPDQPAGPPSVPIIPNIHQQIYAAASQPGALQMDNWHRCEKTHCRAGWAVTLAGAQGKALEAFYNTELAAMLIYDASALGFKINPARFYDDNESALADMKRLSEGAVVS